VPAQADLATVPAQADLATVPAQADLATVPAQADLATAPAQADLATAPAQADIASGSGRQTTAATRSQTDAAALALLTLLVDLPTGPDRARVRERLVGMYLPLAEHLARRFSHRGEPLDDLVQVASLALLKSIDGFDATRGAAFTSYAIPMIVGELKRHFRDKGWDVRVPRRLQELRLEITKVSGDVAQRLRRSPTVSDLATELHVGEEEIIEALDCSQAYRALSLQAPVSGDDTGGELVDLLGEIDPGMETVENRAALRPLLARLPHREQRIISMRFFGNMTQSQIAAELGISQMHVSRLLAHALGILREGLLDS
jgi:RNA polymerase sigma-B factor